MTTHADVQKASPGAKPAARHHATRARGATPQLRGATPGLRSGLGNHATARLLGLHAVPGGPLADPLRRSMESSLGVSLADVWVHAGAASAARRLGAAAFTIGNDIFFDSGRFQPETATGRRLLAHELVHVAQQRRAGVEGVAAASVVSSPDDEAERESTELAPRVAAGAPVTARARPAAAIHRGPADSAAAAVDTRLEAFKQLVREIAKARMEGNSRNLEAWKVFLDGSLTPKQEMGQVLATEAQQLHADAVHGGSQTKALFDLWANTSNPGYRFLYENQIHGRFRACTGCHVATMAHALEQQNTPAWQTPTDRLRPYASDLPGFITALPQENAGLPGATTVFSTKPAAPSPASSSTAGAQPSSAELLALVQKIHPFLQQLGPAGYQVLPNDVFNENITPDQLRLLIDQNIASRQADYKRAIQAIDDGDISYLDLEPVLNVLLPQAEPDVRARVEAEKLSRKIKSTIKEVLAIIAKIALLLLLIFPPTSLIAIGIGLTAGPFLIGKGAEDIQRGRTLMLFKGAHDVMTPELQSQGVGLVISGAMDIFSGVLATTGGALGAWARAGGAGGPAPGLVLASRTFSKGDWTVTYAADGASAVATSARAPGMLLFADANGVAMFRIVDGTPQLVAFRPWPVAPGGAGVATAAGGGGVATGGPLMLGAGAGSGPVPLLGPGTAGATPSPFLLGPGAPATPLLLGGGRTVPLLPGAPTPYLLGAGNPTSLTLRQVLNLRGSARWQAGEDYVTELYGGTPQVHSPVALDPTGQFPVSTPGGRFTDTTAAGGGGRTLGIEVKLYQRWRTVEGVPQEQSVPLSDKIREQINKDVALRNANPNFDPRWIFLDAPPSAELVEYLRRAGIVVIQM